MTQIHLARLASILPGTVAGRVLTAGHRCNVLSLANADDSD